MTTEERLQRIENTLDTILQLLQKDGANAPPAPMLYAYMEKWLAECKAPKIKPKSLAILRSGIERYIKPTIPDKPLTEVRTAEMLNAIENCPHSYMRQVVYSEFRAVFRRAYQYDLIPYNPAEKLDFVKHYRKKGKALTQDEQKAFLRAIEKEPMRPLWLFYLLSGCRCSEVLPLKWADIETAESRIYIRGTKTERAERYIPLFPALAEVLVGLPRESEYVFPYTLRAIQYNFNRIRKENGFAFRIHDLRHTFATRCLESGIAPNTVQKWLGHASIATTANVYSHILTDFERQEMQRFNPRI